jgi:hypothetical protein
MLIADATLTLHLLITGLIPGWAGALLWLVCGAFVLHQLRRDFARIKPTRLTRWILPALRVSIVTLIAWLLCQPMLLVENHWLTPPQVLLIVDSGNSMRVNEGAGDITRQLDALDAVGKPPMAKRNNAASRGARSCGAIGQAVSTAVASLTQDLDAASTGLPLGPSVCRTVGALAVELRPRADELISARVQLPADAGDKELNQSLADLNSAWQVIAASIDSIIADGAIVSREASKSPSLLDAYVVRLKKLIADNDAASKRAASVQAMLDKKLLTDKDIADLRGNPISRRFLAEMAADRLSAPKSDGPSWIKRQSPSLADALDDAFANSLTAPLAAVVILSDGSSPLPVGGNVADSPLARLKIPVHTILIGADGEEPADAGLIAVEAPRIALIGDAITLRCLVKNLVVATPPPKLIVTSGKDQIATRDLSVNKDGYDVIEFSWRPTVAGRIQLVFRIESAQADAYPGNETSAAVVDVISNKARVLIVSDRLTSDFAAVSQILSSNPAVDAHTILAVPGLSKFRAGSSSDEFPSAIEDFKALSAVILIGDVPEGAGAEQIQALRQAIDSGLRVWIQVPLANRSTKSWASALGIETRPMNGRGSISPVDDLWLDLYELGRDSEESAARWKALSTAAKLSEIVTPGIGLLKADGRPVLTLIPRKAGSIQACGVGDFAALRGPANGASVNRLLAESLTLTLRPIGEPPSTDAGLFPPQPVLGKNVFVIGDGSNIKGVEALDPQVGKFDGGKIFRVTDSQEIGVHFGSASIDRIVRPLLSQRDFQLAAHDAPLAQIAAATGGRHGNLFSAMDVLPPGLSGTPQSSATRIALWPGSWSLVLILGLVSAEYLLRRRAGKVM